MNKKVLIGSLVASMILPAATPAYARGNDVVGGIIGGVIGGVLGSNVGRGDGRTAAIIVGAIAGSLIGNQVGRDMDDNDRRACGEAQRRALRDDLGRREDWRGRDYGSRTDAYGSFTTTREGYNYRTGDYCREYRSEIYSRGRTEVQTGVACTRQDGSWYEVESREVSFGGRRDDRGGDRRGGDLGGNRGPIGGNIGDLPDGGRPPRYPGEGPVRPTPPPPVQNGSLASAQISGITRRSGGEWIRVTLNNPASVRDIQLRVLSAGLKIHEAYVYTDYNGRIPVREFLNSRVLYAGENIISENLNIPQRITAIDLRIESMGGYADALVSVDTDRGYTNLSVSRF